MKSAMEGHVADQRNVMYKESCEGVQKQLKKLVSNVREQMENAADEIYAAIHRDYRSALGGGDLKPGEIMPKWQRDMRVAVLNAIEDGTECLLRCAMGLEPEQPIDKEAAKSGVDGSGSLAAIKEEDTEMHDATSAESPPPRPFGYDGCADEPDPTIKMELEDGHNKGEAGQITKIKPGKTEEELLSSSSLQRAASRGALDTGSSGRILATPVRDAEGQGSSAAKMQEDWYDAPEKSSLDEVDGQGTASPGKQSLPASQKDGTLDDSGVGFVGSSDAPEQKSLGGSRDVLPQEPLT